MPGHAGAMRFLPKTARFLVCGGAHNQERQLFARNCDKQRLTWTRLFRPSESKTRLWRSSWGRDESAADFCISIRVNIIV